MGSFRILVTGFDSICPSISVGGSLSIFEIPHTIPVIIKLTIIIKMLQFLTFLIGNDLFSLGIFSGCLALLCAASPSASLNVLSQISHLVLFPIVFILFFVLKNLKNKKIKIKFTLQVLHR